jgi:hypothetical protein
LSWLKYADDTPETIDSFDALPSLPMAINKLLRLISSLAFIFVIRWQLKEKVRILNIAFIQQNAMADSTLKCNFCK